MLEADIKRHLVRQARAEGCYARRFEDQFSVGFPDTMFIPKGGPVFFIEVKRVEGAKFGPSPRQLIELERLSASQVVTCLVMAVSDKWAVYAGRPAKSILLADCWHDILPNGRGIAAFLKGIDSGRSS